jgi:energy-coupling factor transporter ATP-binding protein EcfA2
MTARLISSIRVEGLFGLYTYSIPNQGELSDAAILYGDNGVGKSTVLRLAFHLLSAAGNRGHRGALYEAQFDCLEVLLASGVKFVARVVEESPSKLLSLEIVVGKKVVAVWEYRPRSEKIYWESDELVHMELNVRGRRVLRRNTAIPERPRLPGVQYGEKAYLEELAKHVPTTFILNADRRLDSDSIADPSDEVELRRTMHFEEPKRINELVARSREIALSQALAAASRWLGRKAVIGTNLGSMNVHSVYSDVLKRLLSPKKKADKDLGSGSTAGLLEQLEYIDQKSAEHARFELATHLPTSDFRRALVSKDSSKSSLAADLLEPYLKSVQGRLDAVEPIYALIDRFVSIVNGLLSDKAIAFGLSQGFVIKNRLGVPLAPSQLSSGEQQLLLLFCYVLTARDNPSIFMIDEPEISLNIKWQRRLVQSLLDISAGAKMQFVFASHSMELLAMHRSKVVKLVDES